MRRRLGGAGASVVGVQAGGGRNANRKAEGMVLSHYHGLQRAFHPPIDTVRPMTKSRVAKSDRSTVPTADRCTAKSHRGTVPTVDRCTTRVVTDC